MIDSIQKLLTDEKSKACKENISNSSIKLINKKEKMEVTIEGFRKEGLKINIDRGKRDSFFPSIIKGKGKSEEKEKRYRRICDYLILLPNSSGADVYFIEMKKTIANTQDHRFENACDQILSTVPFLDYLVSMIKTHHDKKLNTDNIKKHFVVIAKRKLEMPIKPETRDTKQRDNRKFKGENFALRYFPKKGGSLSVQYLKCPTPS